MPLAPFIALQWYGPGAASMSRNGGVGIGVMDAQPIMTKRTSATITGTGTAQVLRPYRGYAAAVISSGNSFSTITPHQTMKISLTVAVGAVPSAEDISQSVWNAAAAKYNYAGTMGNKLNSAASGGVDYAALGQAVWAVLLADMTTGGSAGEHLKKLLTTGKFVALKD